MTKATVLIEENHNLIYSYLHKLHVSQASISRMLAFIKEKVYE